MWSFKGSAHHTSALPKWTTNEKQAENFQNLDRFPTPAGAVEQPPFVQREASHEVLTL